MLEHAILLMSTCLTTKIHAQKYKAIPCSLWNNSLISISILRDYWLETMRDGHKHLLIYLDFLPESWGWFLFTVCFYGAKVSICILLEEIIR